MYDADTDGGGRLVKNVHGILFLFRVTGFIRVFEPMHMMQVLTTAMVSLAMASVVTDFIMMYGLKFSGKYTLLKYQLSPDFTSLGKLTEAMEKRHGPKYDKYNHKALRHADVLNDCTESRT